MFPCNCDTCFTNVKQEVGNEHSGFVALVNNDSKAMTTKSR
jgi:hypothetical protein